MVNNDFPNVLLARIPFESGKYAREQGNGSLHEIEVIWGSAVLPLNW
jgi:hypothetical protein